MALTIVSYVSWVVWWYFNIESFDSLNFILLTTLPPLVLSILFTILFLHLDKLCRCCCNPREQLSVYDPDLDKRFIKKEGKWVEDNENDVEASEDDKETETKDEKDVEAGEKNKLEIVIPDTNHQTPGRA